MLKRLSKFAYRLFGKFVFKHRDIFPDLQESLKTARLPYTSDEYISLVILLSILSFVVVGTASYFAFPVGDVIIKLVLSFFTALGVTSLLVVYLLGYPRAAAVSRASEIEKVLPVVVMHMATLAGSKIPPYHIFRIVGNVKRYGELARECRIIYRDVVLLGKDIFTAISDAARHSPSRLWSEILWGISSTLRSGGSLREYLYNKSRELQELIERREREAIETLNLLSEVYLIIFVMGPILGSIMLILASMMMGGNVLGVSPLVLFGLMVYVVMPALGLIFVLVADNIRPRDVS